MKVGVVSSWLDRLKKTDEPKKNKTDCDNNPNAAH